MVIETDALAFHFSAVFQGDLIKICGFSVSGLTNLKICGFSIGRLIIKVGGFAVSKLAQLRNLQFCKCEINPTNCREAICGLKKQMRLPTLCEQVRGPRYFTVVLLTQICITERIKTKREGREIAFTEVLTAGRSGKGREGVEPIPTKTKKRSLLYCSCFIGLGD